MKKLGTTSPNLSIKPNISADSTCRTSRTSTIRQFSFVVHAHTSNPQGAFIENLKNSLNK